MSTSGKINLDIQGFSGYNSNNNGFTHHYVAGNELFHSLLLYGIAKRCDLFRLHWLRTPLYKLYRSLLSMNCLDEDNGVLHLHKSFYDMDSSEKAVCSYFLGNGFTKYITEKKFNIPWLIHTDELIKTGIVTLKPNSNSRGDFIGKDNQNNWYSIESKGRQKFLNTILTDAKDQAKNISRIYGNSPYTEIASVAFLNKNNIRLYVHDPYDEDPKRSEDTIIDKNKYLDVYYRQIVDFISERKPISINRYSEYFNGLSTIESKFTLGNWIVTFGILRDIKSNPASVLDMGEELIRFKEKLSDHPNFKNFSIKLDGTFLKVENRE